MRKLFLHQLSIIFLTVIMIVSLSEVSAQTYDY